MIQNRNIIIISLQSWDIEIGSNCKNIAIELARNNKVLYINSPLDRFTIWRQRNNPNVQKRLDIVHGKQDDLVEEQKNLWILNPRTIFESVNRIPWKGLFDRVNRINNNRFAAQIKKTIDRLHFRDFILFNDGNMFRGFYLKELIKPAQYIYYKRDNFLFMDFWKRWGTRIEPALMLKSDLVLTNSPYLKNLAGKYNPQAFDIGQGCDLSLYNPRREMPEPPEMASIPRPIIGYTGALVTMRLDIEIIRNIALSYPLWSVVLVGPEDEQFRKSDLHRIKNVYFLGSRPPDTLPEYIKCFSVAINPQVLNEITQANYPRKIDEYLAMGKPVVATRQETMSLFADYTYLASDKEEYVALVQKALYENSPELERQRERFAHNHSWRNSVEKMMQIMEDTVSHEKDSVNKL